MLCTSPLIRSHLSFDSSSVFVSVSGDPVQRHALAISFHVTRIVLSPFRLSPALTVCLCILLTVYIVVQAYTRCVLWIHARVFPLCATFIYPIKSRHHYYSTRLFTLPPVVEVYIFNDSTSISRYQPEATCALAALVSLPLQSC